MGSVIASFRKSLFLAGLSLFFTHCARAETFWGAGFQALTSTSPKPSGWAAVAVEVSAGQHIFSFNETDFTVVRSPTSGFVLQTSARSGLATPLRTFSSVTFYALADAGVATTGINSGGAYSGGGLAVVPIKKTSWSAVVGYRLLKTSIAGTTHEIELGFIHKNKD